MSATTAAPDYDSSSACTIPAIIVIGLCLGGLVAYLLVNRLSTLAVLRTGGKYQTRTLELLKEGIDAITLEEYQALYDRFLVLADMRTGMRAVKGLPALLPAGLQKRRWLMAARALRDDAETAFETAARDAIGAMIADRRKDLFSVQQRV